MALAFLVPMDANGEPVSPYQRCRAAMLKCGSDPSLLLWMRASPGVLKRTTVGEALLKLCADQGVTRFDKVFRGEAIKNEKRESENKNSKLFFSDTGKQEALDGLGRMLERQGLHGPVSPFLTQASPGNGVFRGSVFTAWAFFRSGVEHLDIMRQREGIMYQTPRGIEVRDVITMFEHSPATRGPCFFFLDWEALDTWWNDSEGNSRRTADEISAIALKTPQWVYDKMLSKGMLEPFAVCKWTAKNKTRVVKGARKISWHFQGHIAGVSTLHHRLAADELFHEFRRLLGDLKKEQRLPDALSDDELDSPKWGVDVCTMGGNGGFATANSRKTRNDPEPVIVCTYVFQDGQLIDTIKYPPLPEDAGAQARCQRLRKALFTAPPESDFCNYTEAFIEKCNRDAEVSESRTLIHERQGPARSHPTTSRGGTHRSPPFDGQQLPAWLRAASAPNMVITDKHMPFLTRMTMELEAVRSDTHFRIVHVLGMFCPSALYDLAPRLHHHRSNAIYVAMTRTNPVVFYARCSYCKRPHKMQPGTKTLCYEWIQIEEEALPTLLAAARASSVEGKDVLRDLYIWFCKRLFSCWYARRHSVHCYLAPQQPCRRS